MKFLTRLTPTFCVAALALAACDPAEFDADPEVRGEARGGRLCIGAVNAETGTTGASVNQTLPIVELNQVIIDVPATQARWMCLTDDTGNPQSLYEIGQG